MTKSTTMELRSQTAGDAAVDGLGSGFFAGMLMAVYVALYGMSQGLGGGFFFAMLSPAQFAVVSSLVAHLALAAVYGAIFGVGIWLLGHWRRSPQMTLGMALLYCLVLALLARTLVLPNGLPQFSVLPWQHLLLSHLLYGVALGLFFNRAIPQSRKGG